MTYITKSDWLSKVSIYSNNLIYKVIMSTIHEVSLKDIGQMTSAMM